jgi:5-methylcytosine-specific restriction enzyme B
VEDKMFNFIKKWFKKPIPEKQTQKHSNADEIRKYAKIKYIIPARQKGEKTASFTAADVHSGLGLKNSYPNVCSAIDSKKFREFARVKQVKRSGPERSSTVKWTFKV